MGIIPADTWRSSQSNKIRRFIYMFMYFAIKGWSFSQAIYCFLINPVMTITIPKGYFSMPTFFMFFSAFLVYTPHLPVSPDIHTIMAVAAIQGTDLLFRVDTAKPKQNSPIIFLYPAIQISTAQGHLGLNHRPSDSDNLLYLPSHSCLNKTLRSVFFCKSFANPGLWSFG